MVRIPMMAGPIPTRLVVYLVLQFATRDITSSLAGLSTTEVKDNGYTNIAVAIKPAVTPNDELIVKIKEMFTEASAHLYRATHHRLFFHDVTIFVPQTWPSRSSYTTQSIVPFANSDVVIESSSGRNPSPPYTRQHRGCGKEGSSINFMDSFMLDPDIGNNYASLGHILLHEWGHYRWGLFDETPSDDKNQFYYSSLTHRFEGARCSNNITGTPVKPHTDGMSYRECMGNSTVGYEDGCLFLPTEDQQEATGSVMYGRGKYDAISDFCDSDPMNRTSLHNREASSRHNRLCDRRSNWDVMREHADLMDGNNPPRELTGSELQPTFNIVRQGDKKIVLLLETSAKMRGNPLDKMRSAAAAFISWKVPVGTSVSVMMYRDKGELLSSGFVKVQTDTDRQMLLDVLPTFATGKTSLGNALYEAKKMVEEHSNDTTGCRILLINGFKEDQFPYIDFVMENGYAGNFIVDTVAITQQAEPNLAELSRKTGGRFYYDSSDSGSVGSVTEAYESDVSVTEKQFQILEDSWTLQPAECQRFPVYIDITIGKDTNFAVSWLQITAVTPNVTLIDPNGSPLTASYPGFTIDTNLGLTAYRIQGLALEGLWTVVIENSDPTLSIDIHVSVTSSPRSADVPPIVVTSSINELDNDFTKTGELLTIYAEVRHGYNQVVNAVVTGLVSIPNILDPVEVQLFDNGAGADITKNDGIYSGYHTNYTVDGFYGVAIRVENVGDASVIEYPPASSSRVFGSILANEYEGHVRAVGDPAPIFKRLVSAGSSRMVNVPAVDTDVLPPGKITDLRVVDASHDNKTVTLEWTATGDDFDKGQAASYELTRGPDVDAFLTNTGTVPVLQSDVKQGDLNDPKVSGITETFTLVIPVDYEVSSFAFSVIARDKVGLASHPSNVVVATVRRYIHPDDSTTVSSTTDITGTTGVRVSIPVDTDIPIPVDTDIPTLSQSDIITISVIGSVGLITTIIIASFSIFKCFFSSKVVPSRPVSKTSTVSTRIFLDKEQEKKSMKMIDLEMQGDDVDV